MSKMSLFLLPALAALGLAGWVALAPAQETPQRLQPPGTEEAPEVPEPGSRDDMAAGRSLVERGAELFLRGLMKEVGPQLDEMQEGLNSAAKELGPKLGQIFDLIDDVKNYEAPERLPNGDILIRRQPGATKPPPLPAPDERAKPAPGGAAPDGSAIDL